ncbi:MAG: hypothetical protein ABFD81_01305 [Syntrophaceae bacterium]
MWWIIILIPLAAYLGVAILPTLNLFTLSLIGITLVIFLMVEYRQVRRDQARSRIPIMAMAVIMISFLSGVLLSLMK